MFDFPSRWRILKSLEERGDIMEFYEFMRTTGRMKKKIAMAQIFVDADKKVFSAKASQKKVA
jgi:hypothetical protein